MKKIRVIAADYSQDYLFLLRRHLEMTEDIELLDAVTNGNALIDSVRKHAPDVLITDVLLRQFDGLSAIQELKRNSELPATIIVSSYLDERSIALANAAGVDGFMKKPYKVENLLRRIRSCAKQDGLKSIEIGYEVEITKALTAFGLMPHLMGYRYVKEAVIRCIYDSEAIRGVTKVLYPDLAKIFDTTPKCVERAMRNAIASAWRKPNADREDFFRGALKNTDPKPTNTALIAVICRQVMANHGRAWD